MNEQYGVIFWVSVAILASRVVLEIIRAPRRLAEASRVGSRAFALWLLARTNRTSQEQSEILSPAPLPLPTPVRVPMSPAPAGAAALRTNFLDTMSDAEMDRLLNAEG